tara:strand:+ start:329 stop:781 length:453 start_codon:yes stop_codon:yes gene_type:complete
MSTVILDTITGKSTATTITIGSTPVVSASANSMTIRGEGSAQTSIQQGLAKAWVKYGFSVTPNDSFNVSGLTDNGTGDFTTTFATSMTNDDFCVPTSCNHVNASTTLYACNPHTYATNSVRCDSFQANDNPTTAQLDANHNSVAILGDLA